jgi:signal transduction histidine kinase
MVNVRLGELRDEPATVDARALEEVRQQVESAIQASRSLTFELSSALLYELGLEAALGSLAERYDHRHGLRVDFEAKVQPRSSIHSAVVEDTAVILYRAVRELLRNVVKHAGAKSARVSLERDGNRVRITVEDDGAGFDAARAGESRGEDGGFGLFSLRQQLASMGGRLEVCSTAGEGSRVVVVAPARGRRRGQRDSR